MNMLGNWGELLAQRYLRKLSFKILQNNFMSSTGEVDIICIDDDELVFVEVKTWQYYRCPELEYVISRKKRSKMEFAARAFLNKNKQYLSMHIRFDVILILTPTMDVQHFRNVFE